MLGSGFDFDRMIKYLELFFAFPRLCVESNSSVFYEIRSRIVLFRELAPGKSRHHWRHNFAMTTHFENVMATAARRHGLNLPPAHYYFELRVIARNVARKFYFSI
jgi:hypothetical protein